MRHLADAVGSSSRTRPTLFPQTVPTPTIDPTLEARVSPTRRARAWLSGRPCATYWPAAPTNPIWNHCCPTGPTSVGNHTVDGRPGGASGNAPAGGLLGHADSVARAGRDLVHRAARRRAGRRVGRRRRTGGSLAGPARWTGSDRRR